MYCLYCDSPVRFKAETGIREKLTYGSLALKLDSLLIRGDTISFLFKFLHEGKECDTNMVYAESFPCWGIRFTDKDTNSIQLFLEGEPSVVRYFKPEDPSGPYLKSSFPNVVKYIHDNRNSLDPWFKEEAIKRGILKP